MTPDNIHQLWTLLAVADSWTESLRPHQKDCPLKISAGINDSNRDLPWKKRDFYHLDAVNWLQSLKNSGWREMWTDESQSSYSPWIDIYIPISISIYYIIIIYNLIDCRAMPHMPRFQTHPGDIDAFDADPDGDLIWPQGHPQPKVCQRTTEVYCNCNSKLLIGISHAMPQNLCELVLMIFQLANLSFGVVSIYSRTAIISNTLLTSLRTDP